MSRKEERNFNGVWDIERLLANYLYFADEDGCITIPEQGEATPYVIRQRRFLAALKAYGKEGTWFCNQGFPCSEYLVGSTHSEEKMNELRQLLKDILPADDKRDRQDVENYLVFRDEDDISFCFSRLFKYRKSLYAVERQFSGVYECSRSLGIIIRVTQNLCWKHINEVTKVIDRILILFMGDDYDKTFTEKELFAFGYPDVTDDELYDLELEY